MRRENRAKGSMTVFLSMVLMVYMSLFLTLAESIRLEILSVRSMVISEQAIESLHSMYLDALWEEYGVTGMDLSLGRGEISMPEIDGILMKYVEENASPAGGMLSVDYTGLRSEQACMDSYGLLSDASGAPFVSLAVKYQLSHVGTDLVDLVTDDLAASIMDSESISSELGADIEQGSKALEEARNAPEPTDEEREAWDQSRQAYPEKDWSGAQDPMPNAGSNLAGELLSIYFPPEEELSAKAIGLNETLSHRNRETGTERAMDIGVSDRLIYESYVLSKFSNFTEPAEEKHPLSYETEYILAGKASDQENLLGVIHRIMAMREAENLLSIMSDSAKIAEAGSFATTLVGASGNPALIEIVKIGLIASWAYGESLLDMRALLHGKKIPIIKAPEDWTSTLCTLALCFDPHEQAREIAHGIGYKEYLRILLTAEKAENLGLRSMDLCEAVIRTRDGYGNICLDHLMYKGSYSFAYEAGPLFLSLVPEGEGKEFCLRREHRKGFSYIDSWYEAVGS